MKRNLRSWFTFLLALILLNSTQGSGQTVCDLSTTPGIQQSGNQLIASAGISLKWYKSNDFGTVLASGSTFTPTLPGGYVVVSNPTSGCYKTSPVFNFNCPSISDTIGVIGMTGTVAGPGSITSYKWSKYVDGPKGSGGGFQAISSGAFSASYTATQTGVYQVYVTYANTCVATLSAYIDGTITGIDGFGKENVFFMYPNPVKDVLHVSGFAEIFDLVGNKMMEGTNQLDVSNLTKGIYVVRTNAKSQKIVKE